VFCVRSGARLVACLCVCVYVYMYVTMRVRLEHIIVFLSSLLCCFGGIWLLQCIDDSTEWDFHAMKSTSVDTVHKRFCLDVERASTHDHIVSAWIAIGLTIRVFPMYLILRMLSTPVIMYVLVYAVKEMGSLREGVVDTNPTIPQFECFGHKWQETPTIIYSYPFVIICAAALCILIMDLAAFLRWARARVARCKGHKNVKLESESHSDGMQFAAAPTMPVDLATHPNPTAATATTTGATVTTHTGPVCVIDSHSDSESDPDTHPVAWTCANKGFWLRIALLCIDVASDIYLCVELWTMTIKTSPYICAPWDEITVGNCVLDNVLIDPFKYTMLFVAVASVAQLVYISVCRCTKQSYKTATKFGILGEDALSLIVNMTLASLGIYASHCGACNTSDRNWYLPFIGIVTSSLSLPWKLSRFMGRFKPLPDMHADSGSEPECDVKPDAIQLGHIERGQAVSESD
jgi:hypothetical protein